MDRSPGFGSNASNLVALFRLALAAPPVLQYLKLATYINSPDRSTKSTRSHINVLSVLVGTRFQVLFHSPPGVLFTFPSRYCSSIGHQVVFRLGGWSPSFPQGFTCPVVLWIQLASFKFHLRGYHPILPLFPKRSVIIQTTYCCPNPGKIAPSGLASSAFARHY